MYTSTAPVRNLKIGFLIIVMVIIFFAAAMVRLLGDAELPTRDIYELSKMEARYLWYRLEYRRDDRAASAGLLDGKNAGAVPVLVYHGILESADDPNIVVDGPNITLEAFKEHMFSLQRAGYQTVDMDDLYLFLRGEKSLPEKSFVLTFDDGRRDSFYPADPVLRVLGYRAVMFVVSGYAFEREGDFYLRPAELRRMAGTGRWDVQSHGENDHEMYAVDPEGSTGIFLVNLLWLPDEFRLETEKEYKERIARDLRESKDELGRYFGKDVFAFAYPFGDFGERETNYPGVKDILTESVESVYRISFFQSGDGRRFSQNYHGQFEGKESFSVRRFSLNPSLSGEELIKALGKGAAKSIPYTDSFDTDNGWVRTWSNSVIQEGELVMNTAEGESGAGVVLDGTYHWQDYYMEARVSQTRGNNVYVWARFQDDNNFAACNFGEKFAHVEESIDGVRRVLRGAEPDSSLSGKALFPLPKGDFTVGVRVDGRNVVCMIDGKIAVETRFLDERLDHGGVGFKTWNPVPGEAELIIKDMYVGAAAPE